MAYPSLPALTAEHDTVVPLDFESLWSEALNKYKDITGTDLRLSEQELLQRLSGCTASDEVLKILEDFVDAFRAKRSGTTRWEKLKVSLEPVVLTVLRFGNHVGGELAQASSLPGGSAVFVALAVLLKAAQDVSARQDDVLHLFERLQAFFERLSVRALIPTSYGSRRIVVKLLIELLELFSIATKMLKSTRMSQFLNALLRQDDIQLAFRRIDALTSSEHQMTSTETLSVSHDLLERLNLVGKHALENLTQHTDLVVRNVQQATTLLADKTDKHTSDIRGDIINSDNRQLRIAEYLRKEVKESSSDIREHLDHHLNVVTHGELARHTTVIRGDMQRLLVQRSRTGLSPEQVKQATYVIGAAVMLSSIPVLPLWVQKFPLLAALFYMYQMMIPKELSPIDANTFSIMLIDAFGDPVTLPLMNCSSWNDLHIALMNHFSTRDGAGLVRMGAYEIEDGKTRRVIDAQSWAKTVKADMFVVMNMVVPQYLSSVKCPRCGTVNEKDSFKDREQVACASCNHVYRVSGIELPPADISEVHPFANSPVSLTRKQHYGPDPPGAKKVPTYATNMGAPDRGEDLSPFQNIHILFSADLSVPALFADSTDAHGVTTSSPSPSPSSSSTHESHARAPLSLGPSGTWTIQKTFRAPRSVLVYSESAKIVSKVWFHSPPLSVSDAASIAAVQITTHSRDQGFVDFPQHNSWSWFEIGVVPTGANGQPDFMRARWLHSHNNRLGDAEIVQRQGQVIGKEQGQWRAGDVIAVSVRAQFPGWLNFAAAGELRFLESVQSMV